jgi:hypothetical protein
MLTIVCHWTLHEPDKSNPYKQILFISLRSTLVLYLTTSRSPKWCLTPGFQVKILCAYLISSMFATYTTHLILLDFINLTISVDEYKL